MANEIQNFTVLALLEDHEKELLNKLAAEILSSDSTVCAGRMGRLGRESIRLLVVYFHREKRTRPFVVKINKTKEIKEEHQANLLILQYLLDAPVTPNPVYAVNAKGEECGALLYPHMGAKGGNPFAVTETDVPVEEPRQFEQIAYDEKWTEKDVLKCLDTIYMKLAKPHIDSNPEADIEWRKDYQDYLERKAELKPIEVAKSVLAGDATNNRCTFLGADIFNPVSALDKLPISTKGLVGPAHGDLHPKNIILDRDNEPNLIDFYWAGKPRHVLVDFVLLENSLRFLLFPKCCNLDDQLVVDKWLLQEDGFLEKITKHKFSSEKMKNLYIRQAGMVHTIRQCARRVKAIVNSFDEYLLSQFFVLYGLLSYREYADCITVRALGLIANELLNRESGKAR